MSQSLPQMTRVYQNHHLDSTRWDSFAPREDDIIIATSYKSGTTWMQTIVLNLIFGAKDVPSPVETARWLDNRANPLEDVMAHFEAQAHRRVIKTHLPLDGLPFHPDLKYIVVGRDGRDVFMSLWNHYKNYTPEGYAKFNDTPGRVGGPVPECPDDIRIFWHNWISRGWFEWDTEGYPFWSNFRHTQTWWKFRHLPNILFVHFNDLLKDLRGEVRRISEFLDMPVTGSLLADVVEAATFSTMKKNAEKIYPEAHLGFKGGAQTFINKGTNRRWEGFLGEEEMALYEDAVARELTLECALWLEFGRWQDQRT